MRFLVCSSHLSHEVYFASLAGCKNFAMFLLCWTRGLGFIADKREKQKHNLNQRNTRKMTTKVLNPLLLECILQCVVAPGSHRGGGGWQLPGVLVGD